MACPTVGRRPTGLGHSNLPCPAIPITNNRDLCCGTRYRHASSTCTCTPYPRLSSSLTKAINGAPPCAWAKFGTFSKSIARGFNRSTMAKKLRQRLALVRRGGVGHLSLTKSPIFDMPAVEKGWHGGPPARRSTSSIPQSSSWRMKALGSERSPVHVRPSMFAACVSVATGSESAAATTENPLSSSPKLNPPAPQNRSIAQGRGLLSSQARTRSPSLGSGEMR